MSRYYTLLGIDPTASQVEIDAAYTQQRERYNPERVTTLDEEMRRIAEERTAELDRAYHILSDPQRRRQYDISIGIAAPEQHIAATQSRRRLSARELWYAAAGGLAAVALVAVIWMLTGREGSTLPSVGEVDRPAPDFTLPALNGGNIQLSDYRGNVVLVNFWGTWCEPCKKELPALQASYEQLREQGFIIIGINLVDDEKVQGKTEDDIRAFVDQYGVTYPIALDIDGEVANAYRLFPLPTSYFVDPQGRIRYVRVGELTKDEVTALFTRLQQKSTALLE